MKEKVTILMTTYNEEKEIFSKALESILNQTIKDIKILIIVDNKENVDIINVINEFQRNDNRISYYINEKTLGLAESLNKGIDMVDTKYIARMDSDDIAFENRIEKQLEYAELNSELDIFGSNIIFMDYFGNVLNKRNKHSIKAEKIKEILKYINIFHHPTFFGKTKVLKKYKYRNITYSQDYELICRLIENNQIVGNMEEYLLYYRLPASIDDEKLYKQKISYFCIQELYAENRLAKTNISNYIEEKLKDKNKEKIKKSFLIYEKALDERRKLHYIKFIIYIIYSCFLSKHQRKQVKNVIRLKLISKGK